MRQSLVLIGAVLLVGCGGDDGGEQGSTESGQPLSTVKAYQTAFLERDGDTFCDLLTGDAKRAFIADFAVLGEGPDCPKTFEKLIETAGRDDLQRIEESRDALTSDDVARQGGKATVTLRSGRRLKLTRAGNAWLLAETDLRP